MQSSSGRGRAHSLVLGAALLAGLCVAAPAQAQDDTLIEGRRLYAEGACANCHGNRGQGGGGVDFPQGPSLRTSALDRESMMLIIGCGIPGTRMPAWRIGAYTEFDCYGAPVGEVPSGTLVTGIFTEEQIGSLVDYITQEFMRSARQ